MKNDIAGKIKFKKNVNKLNGKAPPTLQAYSKI